MDEKIIDFYQNRLRPADKATILYQFIIIAIIWFHYRDVPHASVFISLHLLVAFVLSILPKLNPSAWVTWLRYWNPVIIIPANFYELHFLVHAVNPTDMDSLLIRLDYTWFGTHPTVWMQNWHHPLLTEYFQLVYTTFYFLPLIMAYILYRQRHLKAFDYFAFVMVLGFYLSYLGYFLVPALGPRHTLEHLHSFALHGYGLSEQLRHWLNVLERIQRDAFPSGHTAITLITMYFAARFHKRYFYILLIAGGSLIISTVYLRYHYVVDVLAGILLCLLVIFSAPMIYQFLVRVGIAMDMESLRKYWARIKISQ